MTSDWYHLLPSIQPVIPLTFFLIMAGLITILTYWTYAKASELTKRRWLALWGLRMFALLVASLVILRPTWEKIDTHRMPGRLVILFDQSKSMLVPDEDRDKTRWDAMVSDWQAAKSALEQLKDDQLKIVTYGFDMRLRDWKPEENANGDQTALFLALEQALDRNRPLEQGQGDSLLGIVLYSDGRDNVNRPSLESVLTKLTRAGCPVHTIGLGQPGGSELQQDLIALSLDAPQIARVKDKLNVTGLIQCQRFENQEVEVWLLIDGKEVPEANIANVERANKPVRVVVKPNQVNQVIKVEFPVARLPEKPGDYRISMRIKPMPGELTDTNNEVSSYMTLTKDGLSVLYLDKDRAFEPKFIRKNLRNDERISLFTLYSGEDQGPIAERWRTNVKTLIQGNNFDVFVIGDIPASRFMDGPGRSEILDLIKKKVSDGAGFLMLGGHDSFADGGWDKTVIGDLLPVDMSEKGQLEGSGDAHKPVPFVPNEMGSKHFALRLDFDEVQNLNWWRKLAPLNGGNRVGKRKPNATVLVETPEHEILLATQVYGVGRVAALSVDTTWMWVRGGEKRNPNDPDSLPLGVEAHLRFWRQLILWLAKQEDPGKSIKVEVAQRRVATGKEQTLTVSARRIVPGGTKDSSEPLLGANFKVRIIRPNKTEDKLDITPDGGPEGKSKGSYWRTDEPGEYEVIVTGEYQGASLGEARARFVVYRDESELSNRSTNFAVLEQIALATSGSHRLHGGLAEILAKLQSDQSRDQIDVTRLPNWAEPNPLLQGLLMAAFILAIAIEWLLRRWWGLV